MPGVAARAADRRGSCSQASARVHTQRAIDRLVDAYNDPNAEADLKAYDEEFSLPECTAANGCFKQVNQNGETGNPPFPKTTKELETARKGSRAAREEAEEATGWALEISLDIEVAHATCQSCEILLVESNTPSYEDLETAEQSAGTHGAGEISNSWSGPEVGETPELESSSPFNHPGIVIAAAAGDDGYLNWDAEEASERGYVGFPASSPHVVAVGGTRLSLGAGSAWAGETVWNGDGATGGGCSVVFTAQPWQQNVSDWSGSAAARNAPSRTSPRTRTPTPGSPSTTRARNANTATKKRKSNTCSTGARSAARASPLR